MRQILFLCFSTLIIIADQISKWWVTEQFLKPALGGTDRFDFIPWLTQAYDRLPYAEIEILPFFNIVMVWNQGISFGLFSGNTDYGPYILIALSFAITLWFVIWLCMTQDKMKLTGIAMVIGGALGNVIDRFRFGAVIDFLDFHIGGWHYPAFNIADSTIVIGVFVLIIQSFFFEKNLHTNPSSV